MHDTCGDLVTDPSISFISVAGLAFEMLMRVSDLTDCLMRRFPEEGRGYDYDTALMLCLECLEGGDSTGEDCRRAFVAACHEVGLSVTPDDNVELDW